MEEVKEEEGGGRLSLGRVQARENRGARYRVTNSATPEIHPFIDAHQVRGCVQEEPRPPTWICILSRRRQPWGFWKQNDPVQPRSVEKKRGCTVTAVRRRDEDSRKRERSENGRKKSGKKQRGCMQNIDEYNVEERDYVQLYWMPRN